MKQVLFWLCRVFYWVLLEFWIHGIASKVTAGVESHWCYFVIARQGGSVEYTLSRMKVKNFNAICPIQG